jgi:hypothetical protein
VNQATIQEQEAICKRFCVEPMQCHPNLRVGVSLNVREGIEPIHGVRVKLEGDMAGWYIWAGDWSNDPDFFVPLCVEHLSSWCPQTIPYLQLPTGWRFLIAPGYEDVWFDAELAKSEEGGG